MNSSGLQLLVKSISRDAAMRAEFKVDPSKVMDRFNLNENERKAILASNSRLGLISGNSIALSSEVGAFDGWI